MDDRNIVVDELDIHEMDDDDDDDISLDDDENETVLVLDVH